MELEGQVPDQNVQVGEELVNAWMLVAVRHGHTQAARFGAGHGEFQKLKYVVERFSSGNWAMEKFGEPKDVMNRQEIVKNPKTQEDQSV